MLETVKKTTYYEMINDKETALTYQLRQEPKTPSDVAGRVKRGALDEKGKNIERANKK